MATSAGEVEVKLTLNASDFKRMLSDSTQGVNQFSQSLGTLERQLLTVFSFAAIANFFKSSLNAYGENQVALVKLTNAMQNQGIATEDNIHAAEAYAAALAQSTGVSKVAIIDSEALLTTFGLQGSKMEQATVAALNMSKAMGVDLHTATLLLGKAFDGVTGTLARYGIIIDKNLDPSQRFQAVLDQINSRFGGVALAVADTYTGRIAKMGEAFRELQVQIGQLLGSSGGLTSWLTALIKNATDIIGTINDATTKLGSFTSVIKATVLEMLRDVVNIMMSVLSVMVDLMSKIPLMGTAFDNLKAHVNGLNKSLNDEISGWQATALMSHVATAQKIADIKHLTGAHTVFVHGIQDMDDKMDAWQENRRAKDFEEYQKDLKEKKDGFDKFAQAFELTTNNMWLAAGQSAKQISDAFAKGMAEVIVKSKDFHDMMISIWQDIEMQVIEYILKMIAKELILLALETATGTLGMGGGGSPMGVFNMGAFAEGGIISEPSIITGLRSGNQVLAGEQGPEAVVPLGSNSGGMSGGNVAVTINIQGQFLEADQSKWRQMVNQQIIPAIRQFTMSSPNGPFNRTRGVT